MTFPAYPEYKDSGVEWLGDVPAHWQVKRMRFVATLNPSKSEVRHLPGTREVSFIPMEAVGEEGSLDLSQERPLGEVIDGYTYLSEGDVTFAKITPCFENGKGAIMRGLNEGIGFGTTELTVARPDTSQVTGDYLYRVISSRPFRELGESHMYGAGGQKRVPDDFLRNFELAWPPVPEQATIAAFLDHETARIDALVEEQQRLIALLKEKRQAVISHAVTKGLDPDVPMKDSGVEWLGEVPAHWEVTRLKFVSHIVDCKNRTPSYHDDGQFLVVRTSNVKNQSLNVDGAFYTNEEDFKVWTQRGVPPEGSILFTREAPAGEVCLVPKGLPLCLGQRMMNIIPSDCRNTRFVFDFLTSDCLVRYIDSVSHGSTVSHLRVEQVYDIPIAVPPFDEQEEIDNKVSVIKRRFEELINEAESATEMLAERRSALISAAVTGKIDVRGWTPPADPTPANQDTRMEAV